MRLVCFGLSFLILVAIILFSISLLFIALSHPFLMFGAVCISSCICSLAVGVPGPLFLSLIPGSSTLPMPSIILILISGQDCGPCGQRDSAIDPTMCVCLLIAGDVIVMWLNVSIPSKISKCPSGHGNWCGGPNSFFEEHMFLPSIRGSWLALSLDDYRRLLQVVTVHICPLPGTFLSGFMMASRQLWLGAAGRASISFGGVPSKQGIRGWGGHSLLQAHGCPWFFWVLLWASCYC